MAKVLDVNPIRVACISCGQKTAERTGATDRTESYACFSCQVHFTTERGYAASPEPFDPASMKGPGSSRTVAPAGAYETLTFAPSLDNKLSSAAKGSIFKIIHEIDGRLQTIEERRGSGLAATPCRNPLDLACDALIAQIKSSAVSRETPGPLYADHMQRSSRMGLMEDGIHPAGRSLSVPGNPLDQACDALIDEMKSNRKLFS